MDSKKRLPDEEKGDIDHRGDDEFPQSINDQSRTTTSTTAATICTSPSILDGKAQMELSKNTSNSTSISSFFDSLRRLTSPWGPKSSDTTVAVERRVCVKEVNLTPLGYPRFAAFLDSDDNFMLYRRFGYLQSRLLLEKQDDLRQLEEALDRMDRSEVEAHEEALMAREIIDLTESEHGNGSLAHDQSHESVVVGGSKRKRLLRRIESTWKEYGEMLMIASGLVGLNRPTSGEQCSVRHWIENVDPVHQADAEFVEHTEDLVTLRAGRDHAWLDAGIEKFLKWCRMKSIRNLFRSKEARMKSDGSGQEVYFTRRRIDRLVAVIITMMILALLIIPIWLLYHLNVGGETPRSNAICIGILLVFTLAFSACILLFTRARRHEILIAAAGYCAVLVVFIGNVNGGFGLSGVSN